MRGTASTRKQALLPETLGGRPGEEAREVGDEAVANRRAGTTANQRVCIVRGAAGDHYHPIGCNRWSFYVSDNPERREQHWLTQANKQFQAD